MADEECDFDDLESVLRHTRRQFVRGFAENCSQIEGLWQQAGAGDRSVLPQLQKKVHQMAGLAGTIGLPTVSERGAALDRLVARWTKTGAGAAEVPGALALIREAFDADLARSPSDGPTTV